MGYIDLRMGKTNNIKTRDREKTQTQELCLNKLNCSNQSSFFSQAYSVL